MLRYGPNAAATPPPVPAPPPAAAPAGNPADDRPQGADLLLYELASGNELNFGNVGDFAFDKKGDWLAWLIDAQDKAGNGVEVRNMETGAVTRPRSRSRKPTRSARPFPARRSRTWKPVVLLQYKDENHGLRKPREY